MPRYLIVAQMSDRMLDADFPTAPVAYTLKLSIP